MRRRVVLVVTRPVKDYRTLTRIYLSLKDVSSHLIRTGRSDSNRWSSSDTVESKTIDTMDLRVAEKHFPDLTLTKQRDAEWGYRLVCYSKPLKVRLSTDVEDPRIARGSS